MSPVKVVLVTVLAGGISIGAAILGERLLAPSGEGQIAETAGPGAAQLHSLPDFSLPDLAGREVASTSWSGKVLVVNYWASWCPPCLREMPMMIRAQEDLRERGVQFVGIALDRPDDVAQFLEQYPVNYPILIGDLQSVELSRRLGNRFEGLPFTVIFDARGRRVFSRIGELTEQELGTEIAAALGDKATAPGPEDDPAEATGPLPKGSS